LYILFSVQETDRCSLLYHKKSEKATFINVFITKKAFGNNRKLLDLLGLIDCADKKGKSDIGSDHKKEGAVKGECKFI